MDNDMSLAKPMYDENGNYIHRPFPPINQDDAKRALEEIWMIANNCRLASELIFPENILSRIETIRRALQQPPIGVGPIDHITLGAELEGKITEAQAVALVNSVIKAQLEIQGHLRTPAQAGWKLVPVEPTEEMRKAGQDEKAKGGQTHHVFAAMIAAAPEATGV